MLPLNIQRYCRMRDMSIRARCTAVLRGVALPVCITAALVLVVVTTASASAIANNAPGDASAPTLRITALSCALVACCMLPAAFAGFAWMRIRNVRAFTHDAASGALPPLCGCAALAHDRTHYDTLRGAEQAHGSTACGGQACVDACCGLRTPEPGEVRADALLAAADVQAVSIQIASVRAALAEHQAAARRPGHFDDNVPVDDRSERYEHASRAAVRRLLSQPLGAPSSSAAAVQ